MEAGQTVSGQDWDRTAMYKQRRGQGSNLRVQLGLRVPVLLPLLIPGRLEAVVVTARPPAVATQRGDDPHQEES